MGQAAEEELSNLPKKELEQQFPKLATENRKLANAMVVCKYRNSLAIIVESRL